jgi:hypothetical protein
MAIGEQFAGLDMGKLIGGPLTAAADASITLARSTADFINTVGFNTDQSARTMLFKFEKSDTDPMGNPMRNEMSLEVPLLAIVPIPNLQIDEVNILFDMEVKECEKSESALDVGVAFSGSAGFGPIKINISGNVSVHQSNTRSSDNSAKYHVDLRATNHGMPEGLARVLDIMAAAAAPTLLASKMVDGDGREVDEATKQKRLALQESYSKQQSLGTSCKAASDRYEASIKSIRDNIDSFAKAQKQEIQMELNKDSISDDDRGAYTELSQKISVIWDRVSTDVRTTVEAAYNEESPEITKFFDMKKLKKGARELENVDIVNDIKTMQSHFGNAVKYYKEFKGQEENLAAERAEYNGLLMKR